MGFHVYVDGVAARKAEFGRGREALLTLMSGRIR